MRRLAPVFVLFILAPFLAEVVLGATTLSRIGGLVPVAALYGGGALLIRELARRRSSGWGRIALLGAAYGIVEEGLTIQSFFNPNLFDAGLLGGRAWGVNWVWTQWMLGYHIVWSIILPILLTELLFPQRRSEPWLGKVGLIVSSALYLIGVVAIGLIFRFLITPDFRTPLLLNIGATLLVGVLVAQALGWSRCRNVVQPTERKVPAPWLIGLLTCLIAMAWFGLAGLPDTFKAGALVLIPMVGELLLAAGGVALLRWWSAGRGWTDLHRLAIVCGAMLVTMLVGFFFVTSGNPIDQFGQVVASLIALALLIVLGWRLHQRLERSKQPYQIWKVAQ